MREDAKAKKPAAARSGEVKAESCPRASGYEVVSDVRIGRLARFRSSLDTASAPGAQCLPATLRAAANRGGPNRQDGPELSDSRLLGTLGRLIQSLWAVKRRRRLWVGSLLFFSDHHARSRPTLADTGPCTLLCMAYISGTLGWAASHLSTTEKPAQNESERNAHAGAERGRRR